MSIERFGAIIAVAALTAGATLGAAQAQQEVHVGVLGPFSGPAASYGTDIMNGFQLAADEINAKGGIAGRKVVLHQGDDRGSAKDAANVAQKFVSDRNVVAMIGGVTSTATFGAVPVAQRNKLPFLITLASHPDLTKEGNYIFRNSTTQEQEGPALARLVTACLGTKKVGIMNLNNDWAIEMTKQFRTAVEPQGVQVLIQESYNPGENVDYVPKIAKVKATNPDIIWFGSQYNDLALILKQAQRMDLGKTPLVASAGDHASGLLKVAGSAADGLYLHTLFFEDSPDPVVQNFVKSFKAKYNAAPNLFSAQAYEGLFMLGEAIKAGGFTRDGTRDALEKLPPQKGVTGTIAFDPKTREAAGKAFIPLVVANNEFTLWKDCAAKLN